MRLKAEDAVTHIVEMGDLHLVKQNHIFQFYRITYHTIITNQRAAADKCAVPHFGSGTNDTRRAQIGGGSDDSSFVRPDLGCDLMKFILRKGGTELQDHILYAFQSFPWIVKTLQIFGAAGVA